jgi:hypothetical protein
MTQIKKNRLVLQSIDYPLISLYKVDRIVIATVSLSEFIALNYPIFLLAVCENTATSKTSKAEFTCQVGMSEACGHTIR